MTIQMDSSQNIESIAEKIISLGLESPALLFLEAHRPLAGILYHLSLFGEPLFRPFFPRYGVLTELLSDESALAQLASILEKKSLAKEQS